MQINSNQLNAGLRHVYTAVGTAFTILVALAVIPQDQVQPALDAIHQIGDGIQQIFGGASKLWIILGPIIASLAAKGAVTAASFKNQLKSVTTAASKPENTEAKKEVLASVATIPSVEKIVDPTVANFIPNEKVVIK